MGKFNERVAIVTGGSRGIGKAIATKIAEEGGSVAIFDINTEALNEAAAEFGEKGYDVTTLQVNVVDTSQVENAVKAVAEKYGKIDVLVNNAGVVRDNLIFRMSDEDWQTVIDVHLKGAFNCSRAVQRYMVPNKYGRIIHISSGAAFGNRGQSNYSAAKAGMIGLGKTLAIELGRYGITTNVVCPGFIETEMTRATAERMGIPFEEMVKGYLSSIWAGRSGKPEDLANAVAFFADEATSYVNGQVLHVNGGMSVG
jgi:3-oxoacyl-[acyl-carrier protein] reductase